MAKRTRHAGRRIAPKRPIDGRSSAPRSSPRPPEANSLASPAEPNILGTAGGRGLTEAELAAAAEIEARIVAEERAAAEAARRSRARLRHEPDADAGDVNAPLSVRAAHEYAYVARDVRRILVTGGLMVAILAALHILVNVLGIVRV